MRMRFPTLIPRGFAVVVIALGMLAGIATVGAQGADGTPVAGGGEGHAFPAHIHSGTCETLGDVVYPLEDLTSEGMEVDATPAGAVGTPFDAVGQNTGTPEDMGAGDTAAATAPFASSETVVEASLDDILAAEHAINVHESAENIGNYVACGNLTGMSDGGELTIQLQELNGSGYTGEAMLVDNGDGTTTVTVNLLQRGVGSPVASPET
jgi:hypothetical protein